MSLDRYFARKEAQARARDTVCPACNAGPGDRCTDQFGLPTSFVHKVRHISEADRAADVYSMGERP